MATAQAKEAEKVVTKRRVTARSVSLPPEADMPMIETERVDYVRPDYLDAYVEGLRTSGRWQTIEVSEEPDAGPAGYDGPTYVPPNLNHPLAGTYYPASDCENCSHAPEGATVVGSEV